MPENIYGATKTAAEDLCELVHRDHGLPILVLRTSRFFPEPDDRDEARTAFDDLNLKVNELLYRRVDLADAVQAHLDALDRAPALGFGRYIISATTPFAPSDADALHQDARPSLRGCSLTTRRSTRSAAGRCSRRSIASTTTPAPGATSAGRHASTSPLRSNGSRAYPGEVTYTDDAVVIDGKAVKVLQVKDRASSPWGDLGVDLVIESTGLFTDADKARAHIDAGAKKVIITAPQRAKTSRSCLASTTRIRPRPHQIICNASCTTNCLAPAAKVVHDRFTIRRGLMNTIHSYTNDQASSTSPTRICAGPALPARTSSRRRPAPRRPSPS